MNGIPGYIYILRGKLIRGILLFCLVLFPAFSLVRVELFQARLDPEWRIALWVLFTAGLAWHAWVFVWGDTGSTDPLEESEIKSLYEKGRLAGLKGNHELAMVCFKKLSTARPEDEDACYQLAKSYMHLKENRQAARIFKKYLQGCGKKWREEATVCLQTLEQA